MTTRLKWTRGLVAAALVLTFGPAHALKIDGDYSVTYAKETFLKAESIEAGGKRSVTGRGTFYNLGPVHMISGPAEVIANGDGEMYEVLFTLQNMVFAGAATLAPADLTRTPPPTTAVPNPDANDDWFVVSRGGAPGDHFVVFTQAAGDNDIGANDMLTLNATLAVTADGPGGITRTITNKALPTGTGLAVTMTHTNADAVKVVRALKVTVALPSTLPMADAADQFMSFAGGTATRVLSAPLGTLTVGVESGIRDARVVAANDATNQDPDVDDRLVTLGGLDGAAENLGIVASGILQNASSTAGSAVTFSGDFTFLKTLALSDNAECTGSLSEIRKPSEADRAVLTDMTMPMAVGGFMDGKTLCAVVDGDTAIPRTEAYMAATAFKGPALNMFPPEGGTHTLAAISRGGTTVHIPFVTVHEKFNQRLMLRNRSSQDVNYTITFSPEMDTTATAGMMASGTVPAGELMVIRSSEIVTLDGNSRTAATLTAPVAKGMLDVATSIVSRDTGSIDVETHMPAE